MKILRAAGERGKHDQFSPCEFNHCDILEPVGLHSMVCCNNPHCGCDRSFTGIHTALATTKAVVSEVSEAEFEAMCVALHTKTLKNWSIPGDDSLIELSQKIADRAVHNFRALPADLERYSSGTVLRVKKTEKRGSEDLIVDLKVIA